MQKLTSNQMEDFRERLRKYIDYVDVWSDGQLIIDGDFYPKELPEIIKILQELAEVVK